MPRLAVWAIRAALLYLALGFTFGALILWNKGLPLHPQLWRLLPAHIDFLLFGWTMQLVLGVAYWILPRFQTRRGNPLLAWLAFALLNVGVWLVSMAPFAPAPGFLNLGGRLAECAAALAFAAHAWPRIKPAGG
ncbi:MAG: hypothetical protein KJZ93_29035 [Caldilineaceae bacterium]|nr:hypothetical protein [Caldilineaceae bacterium]